jgi:acyl phosphate:glycerol-3-phosphate acyltransferase
MNIATTVLLALAGFCIGSVPTAFLLIRRSTGKDLRREGSGNIGAMNAYEVSNSKKLGVLVLVIDLLKGAVPLIAVRAIFGDDFLAASVAMISLVLGHNYSPWIGFKGGRGLATAAGAGLIVQPALVIFWALLYSLSWLPSRNIHVGNIAATVLTPVALWFTPWIAEALSFAFTATRCNIEITAAALCFLILLRHAGPIKELIATMRKNKGGTRVDPR